MKVTKKQKLPKFLQPYLWSTRIDDLDKERDKVSIINQILAYGNMKALQWLFTNYSAKELRKVFSRHPMRIYRGSSFYFAKNILLNIQKVFPRNKYVQTPISSFK